MRHEQKAIGPCFPTQLEGTDTMWRRDDSRPQAFIIVPSIENL